MTSVRWFACVVTVQAWMWAIAWPKNGWYNWLLKISYLGLALWGSWLILKGAV